MTDPVTLTDSERAELQQSLAVIEAAQGKISEAMAPLRTAYEALQEVHYRLTEKYPDIAGTCVGCDRLLFAGEQGHRYADDPITCAACAPTWRDVKDTIEKKPEAYEESEDLEAASAAVAAHEADGTLDAKVLHTL